MPSHELADRAWCATHLGRDPDTQEWPDEAEPVTVNPEATPGARFPVGPLVRHLFINRNEDDLPF